MSIFSKIFGKPAVEPPLLSPFEIGIVLAGSLIEGRSPNEIGNSEADLVRSAGVPRQAYIEERFLLNAAAAAFAALTFLPDGAAKNDVASGFKSWFADNAAKSRQAAELTAAYARRTPAYVGAARKDAARPPAEHGDLIIREIDFVFGDSLLERSTLGPSAESSCRMLAMAIGQAYWSAQLQGSVELFRRAKLIP